MRLNVNPTRMELLKLKKRLALAQRGHKLLKDKLEQLLQRFLPLMETVDKMRREVEEKKLQAERDILKAKSNASSPEFAEATIFPDLRIEIGVEYLPLLNLRVPKYNLRMDGDFFSYGILNSSSYLDKALREHKEIMPLIVELAERETIFRLLAEEIERTRRRVNALEHILIPNIKDTIDYISMKLEELARGSLTRLMRVKEIVRAH